MTDIFEQFSLRERVVIITGGAGLLGSQYAHDLAAAGAHVVVADLHGAEQVAGDVTEQSGVRALGVPTDVSDKASVSALVERVITAFGRIDGLVNNAAIDPKMEQTAQHQHTLTFQDYPVELFDHSLAVNVRGMFLCAQAVTPVMLAQGRGSMVNIASTYGMVGPDQRLYEHDDPTIAPTFKPVAYSVTKAAVFGLTHYLAAYFMGKNIRVNTLTPGGVYNQHADEFVRRYSARAPLGRMADKREYSAGLLFLLSDASSYMTGANLVIDGGWTAW
jgi:2-deoxy-D-gluconate 3-dehydrogenase